MHLLVVQLVELGAWLASTMNVLREDELQTRLAGSPWLAVGVRCGAGVGRGSEEVGDLLVVVVFS